MHQPRVPDIGVAAPIVTGHVPPVCSRVNIDLAGNSVCRKWIYDDEIAVRRDLLFDDCSGSKNNFFFLLPLKSGQWVRHTLIRVKRQNQTNNQRKHNASQFLIHGELIPVALGDADKFVGLQTELPVRIGETIVDGRPGMAVAIAIIQRLQKKMAEIEFGKPLGLRPRFLLWINQL